MKICVIQYNLGATSETFLTRHINLLKHQFDVSCITGKIHNSKILDASKTYEYTKVKYIDLLYNRLLFRLNKSSYIYSNSIFKGIKKIQPDLIVFQFAFLPVLCYTKVAELDIPFVIIHHGTDLNNARLDKAYHNKLKLVWKHAKSVVFVSRFLYDEALKLGLDKNKAEVIYLGVPIKKVEERVKKDKQFNILTIGRLVAVKNQAFLVKAFKIFNNLYPNSKLTIIGDGPLKDNITVLIKELGLSNNVFLTGALAFSQVESYIDKADVFCLTSKKVLLTNSCQEEGLGLTLIEASLRKVPLIGTKSGGIPEVISHTENGLLVDSDNTKELFKALEYLHLNPKKAKAMGEKAYEIVLKKFDENSQIEEFVKVYKGTSKDV
ncbi:glycosyltransferase family 4 protein [Winogradskyella thalassocola]|uniref:Glycosyltransferase involved in cell wall bisynthesis n=1 Tax=Winogradskyella thalassocola TaxID=262004 RepID=A0A1G7Z0X5_9FLAO|nr:glycosyltransferase family 4 protein [Winogradskyella thalassocola]SDH02245.1 Glycosyltransferase involved in cell wall bisynthesis [Winogradskyella thalassocola]